MTVVVLTLLNGMVYLHGGTPGIGLALLGGSALRRSRCSSGTSAARARPLMDLRLFAHRPFSAGAIVAFIYGMALFGSTYLVPVFMQIALDICRRR